MALDGSSMFVDWVGTASDVGGFNPPDISGFVQTSSFDSSINYLQSPVAGFYNPTGMPLDLSGVDPTQIMQGSGLTGPLSIDEASAYPTVSPGPGPSMIPTVANPA